MSVGNVRSTNTISQYKKRSKQLLKRRFGTATLSAQTLVALVPFLIGLKPHIRPSTWRHYKASLVWLLEFWIEKMDFHQSHVLAALAELTAEKQTGSLERSACTGRTSAAKRKSLPEIDRNALTADLNKSPSSYADVLIAVINAGAMTGVRPQEWAGAELYEEADGVLYLKVRNAKLDELRAHGEYRHLRWDSLADGERYWIETAIIALTDAHRKKQLEPYLKALQRVLRETCRRIWPRRRRGYTLYDARHEFAAHAKDFHSREEVAAMMGHATDETATQHYARPRRGSVRPRWLPRPDPEEVARVRRVFERRYDRLQERKLNGTSGFRF